MVRVRVDVQSAANASYLISHPMEQVLETFRGWGWAWLTQVYLEKWLLKCIEPVCLCVQ